MGFQRLFRGKNYTKFSEVDFKKIGDTHCQGVVIPQSAISTVQNAVKGAKVFALDVSIDRDAGKAELEVKVTSQEGKTTTAKAKWNIETHHADLAGQEIASTLKAKEDKFLPEHAVVERDLHKLAGEVKACEMIYEKMEPAAGKQDPATLLVEIRETRDRLNEALKEGKVLATMHKAFYAQKEENLRAALKAILDKFKLKAPDLKTEHQAMYRLGSLKLSKVYAEAQRIYTTYVDSYGSLLLVKLNHLEAKVKSQGGAAHGNTAKGEKEKEKGAAG